MKRITLILIIIFCVLAVDMPFMLAYETSLLSLEFDDEEQINTLNYLKGKEDLRVEYSAEEVSHLEDVKKLMQWADFYFIFLWVAGIIILILIYNLERKEFYKAFLYGGIVSLSVLFLTLLFGPRKHDIEEQ